MDCSICLEPIVDAFRTACGHSFHKKCFLEYQVHCAGAVTPVGGTRFLTCPNCKKTLFRIQAMDLEAGAAGVPGRRPPDRSTLRPRDTTLLCAYAFVIFVALLVYLVAMYVWQMVHA